MTDGRLTHMTRDGRTLCGVRATRDHPNADLPYVAERHAPRHVAGYGMRVCGACLRLSVGDDR